MAAHMPKAINHWAGYTALAERLMAKGFAFASFNYIMKPKGIRPQVWYDYRDAARFLRMNAKKYRLDPTKFGSMGISAGGWLITSAGHGTGDHFCSPNNGQGMRLYDYKHKNFAPQIRKGDDKGSVWASMQNEEPGFPGIYGKWQAVAFDFQALGQFATSGSPAILDIVGDGFKPRNKNHHVSNPNTHPSRPCMN